MPWSPVRYALHPALVFALALAACDGAPDRLTWPLEVRAPVVGEVWVDGELAVVDPLVPARLEVPTPPPFTVTFIGPDGPLTIIDAPGPLVDLRHFVAGPDPVRGTLVELSLQVLDGPAEVVGVADGQVFRAASDGDLLRLTVPRSPDLVLIGLWRRDGRASHLTRRAVADAALLAGRVLALAPEQPLDETLPITVRSGAGGALAAELTEAGLRTGLLLGSGRIEPGVAVAIPRPAVAQARSGIWVRVEDGAAGELPRSTIEAALPLDADGATLEGSTVPGVLPAIRGPDAPAFFDAGERTWTFTGLEDASWVELQIDGRGDCVGQPWRVIAPAGQRVIVPPAVGSDPLDAPIVELRVTAVRIAGDDLAALLADGPSPRALPGRLTARRTTGFTSFWRTGQADCPIHPLRGVYAIDGPGVICSAASAPGRVVVTRCGEVAPLADSAAICGAFDGDGFASTADGPLAVRITDGVISISTPGGALALHPLPESSARPPADAVGDWSRFTLSRQPLNAAGQATAEAAIIEAGVARIVATIGPGGEIRVRTDRWAFDARLVEGDADTGRAEIQTAGCAARPAEVALRWLGDRVEIEGDAIDGADGRRWRLTLDR